MIWTVLHRVVRIKLHGRLAVCLLIFLAFHNNNLRYFQDYGNNHRYTFICSRLKLNFLSLVASDATCLKRDEVSVELWRLNLIDVGKISLISRGDMYAVREQTFF